MKLLTKDSSKRANCDTQKDIEDITNVTIDINSVKAMYNCIKNSITNMTTDVIKCFWKNDSCSQCCGHNLKSEIFSHVICAGF